MNVLAPGKLLLTGAYAVLEGAPAVVVAVDRYAVAHRVGSGASPQVDVSSLYDGQSKLGLGSSAAALVARLGVEAVARGEDLSAADTRHRLFAAARDAHAREQGGGSGVDIAASVYGGALAYSVRGTSHSVREVALPKGLEVVAFFSGVSARTSELRARVDLLRVRARDVHQARLASLAEVSELAARAVDDGDLGAFLAAATAFGRALSELGSAADAPIVPSAFAELALRAGDERAAFFPSGAGGGDVGIYLGEAKPSPSFLAHAARLAMQRLQLSIDSVGVRALGAVNT